MLNAPVITLSATMADGVGDLAVTVAVAVQRLDLFVGDRGHRGRLDVRAEAEGHHRGDRRV
ncbi:MAG: hypothetical protein ACR2HA_07005 [Nocardioides sp.]